MPPHDTLSDKAVAVFAFAAYHQLSSGETVADVVLHDGSGRAADSPAIDELRERDLARIENDRAVFTPAGKDKLDAMVQALCSAA